MQFISGLHNCIECGRRKHCLAEHFIGNENVVNRRHAVQNAYFLPGKTIFFQGNWIKSLFFVKSGSVKNVYTAENGEQQIVGFYFSGEIIGPTSLKQSCHLSSAVSLENSVICTFSFTFILTAFESLPDLRQNILNRSEAEIKHQHETLLGINQYTAFKRLGVFLLDLIKRQNINCGNTASLRLTMTRTDIANYLGLAPETVSRTLAKFRDEGLILTEKKQIRVNDIRKFSAYIE